MKRVMGSINRKRVILCTLIGISMQAGEEEIRPKHQVVEKHLKGILKANCTQIGTLVVKTAKRDLNKAKILSKRP